jgi:hypothetical protein
MSLQHLTLVLNASYEPINIVTARRAIKLVMKGAAYVELPTRSASLPDKAGGHHIYEIIYSGFAGVEKSPASH